MRASGGPLSTIRSLSQVVVTVLDMEEIRTAAVILSALELAPADPSDVTAALLNWADYRLLVGLAGDCGVLPGDTPANDRTPLEASPLASYLADHVDHARIEYWTKVIDRGVGEGRYRPLPVTHADYPARLRQVWDAPPLLFYSRGVSESFPALAKMPAVGAALDARPSLAIVGSRATNRRVLESTEHVAAELAAAGVTIVSGLAAGVDTAAHRGALAGRGHTVAVMGTGITEVFPRMNRDLAAEVARDGALVSQFPPSAPPTRTSFLYRNHVIAAMSDASLLMDGQERSGSRYELERAIEYGRPAFAWAPALAGRRWVQQLVDDGRVRLVDSAAEVRQLLTGSSP